MILSIYQMVLILLRISNITLNLSLKNTKLKTNLANSKTEVDKLDTDKLNTVLVDFSKLSNVVKMKLLKRLCMIY